jgi:hypothetical protein
VKLRRRGQNDRLNVGTCEYVIESDERCPAIDLGAELLGASGDLVAAVEYRATGQVPGVDLTDTAASNERDDSRPH